MDTNETRKPTDLDTMFIVARHKEAGQLAFGPSAPEGSEWVSPLTRNRVNLDISPAA